MTRCGVDEVRVDGDEGFGQYETGTRRYAGYG
jgi:hypothetical protein